MHVTKLLSKGCRFSLSIVALTLLMPGGASACASTNCAYFPPDAGHINVRDYGATGDGVTDDTEAFIQALNASSSSSGRTVWKDRIVYVPDGTYIISRPIEKHYKDGGFASGFVLIGQSRDHTKLSLKDNSPGYNDPQNPKAVLFTTSQLLAPSPTEGGRKYRELGEGNDAYLNSIENMTIEIGSGNAGAIAIDYLANNLGSIRNVTLRAQDNSGATGIAMTRKWPGPALLSNIKIEGFSTGIDIDHTEYGITLEDISLTGQTKTGLRNNHNVVSANALKIDGAPTAIENTSQDGLIVALNSTLSGTGDKAIINNGYMNLRGVKIEGYTSALGHDKPNVIEGIYKNIERLSSSRQSWSLPIKQPPPPPEFSPDDWANVKAYGALPDSGMDATAAIRKAFSSGKKVIYFPHGTYLISENIDIPSSVQKISGMTSTIAAHPKRHPAFMRDRGMFRARNNEHPLLIERLTFDHTDLGDQMSIEAIGNKALTIKDVFSMGTGMLTRNVGAGEVFLENVCCGPMILKGNKGVWARQLNTEGERTRILNYGSPLWILGLKVERNTTVIRNMGGAKTEVLGGLIYIVSPITAPVPAFINQDSQIFLSYVEEAFYPDRTYATHLLNIQSGKQERISRSTLPFRNQGKMVPAIVGD